jgi:hypothetical protein
MRGRSPTNNSHLYALLPLLSCVVILIFCFLIVGKHNIHFDPYESKEHSAVVELLEEAMFLTLLSNHAGVIPELFIQKNCTAQQCTALHCTALHYTTLHYTTLHYTVLHYSALHCTVPHCTALHCIALHCTTLHCTALNCTLLNHTALHCTVLCSF